METYKFTFKKAKEINNNEELLNKEALKMKEIFSKQGNERHTLEGSTIYNNALFMEKVFYEQVVPKYKKIK